MEKLLKVLLSVDDNNYKIAIKTKTFTNSVPFADFKLFVYDKHQLLFSDRNYVWKIFDSDFGEYITLEDNTPIYDMSKILAIASKNVGNERNERASLENSQRASLEDNQRTSFETSQRVSLESNQSCQTIDYNHERTRPVDMVQQQQTPVYQQQRTPQMYEQQRPPQRTPLLQSAEIDLRDFVSAYRSPAVQTMQERGSFKTYYPSNQGSNYGSNLPMSSPLSSNYSNYSQTSGVMSGYDFQNSRGGQRSSNPFVNAPLPQSRILSPPSYYTNLQPTSGDRYRPYDNYGSRNQSFPTGNVRKRLPLNKKSTQKKTAPQEQAKKVEIPAEPLKKFTFDNLESKEKIVKAVLKYNEEFLMISQLEEDIWKTSNIWNFVAREITGQTDSETMFGIKLAFKEMLKKYVLLLDKDVVMSSLDMKKLCPLFDFMHKKLDLRPFHENIDKLKEAFNSNTKYYANDTVTSSDDKDVEIFPIETVEKESPAANQKTSEVSAPTPVKQTVEKIAEIKFDLKQDTVLLASVSNFVDEFKNELILEDEVWSKVAKDANESADENEYMKCKTRFYCLLKQYKELCENNSAPISKSEKSLKFLFSNVDIAPFEKSVKQREAEADDDCLVVAEDNNSSANDISMADIAESSTIESAESTAVETA